MKAGNIIAACFAGYYLFSQQLCFATEEKPDTAFKPYIQVKTVEGDERTVRVFFSPTCSYSRAYNQFFRNLKATLPETKKLVYTPLINKADGINYVAAFLAVEKYFPNHVNNFLEASYVGTQDKQVSITEWSGLDRIGKAAHLPVDLSKLVFDHRKEIDKELHSLHDVQKSMQITNTPSVAVAGTYIVTPEFTQGDAAMFSQLVNGLISMAR